MGWGVRAHSDYTVAAVRIEESALEVGEAGSEEAARAADLPLASLGERETLCWRVLGQSLLRRTRGVAAPVTHLRWTEKEDWQVERFAAGQASWRSRVGELAAEAVVGLAREKSVRTSDGAAESGSRLSAAVRLEQWLEVQKTEVTERRAVSAELEVGG